MYTGLPGPLTIINTYSSDYPSSFWGVLIGTIIAIVLPIVLVQIFGYGDDVDEETIDAPLTTAENR